MDHDHHMMTTPMPNMMHHDHNMSHHHGNMSTTMTPHHHHVMTTMNHSNHAMGGHEDHTGTGDHDGHGAMHTMKMYFHTEITEFILFESLHTSNTGGIVGACFAMFFLSVMYEGLKYFREYLLRRAALRSNVYAPSMNGGDVIAHKQPEVGSRMLSGSHGLQTFLHMVQVFVSYCLMLVFMTYNVWLCISIVLGAGVGYFLFGWRRATVVDLNEHCH